MGKCGDWFDRSQAGSRDLEWRTLVYITCYAKRGIMRNNVVH